MSSRYLLILSISLLLLCLSSLSAAVSVAEAAKTKTKKHTVSKNKKKDHALLKKRLSESMALPDPRPQELRLPPSQMEEEYLAAEFDPEAHPVIQKAMGLLGIRYRFGGSNYNGIDCSAFVRKVFALNLPRTAREQFAVGIDVPSEELQKGDLLFYQTYAGFPSHVGIYLGKDLMIHASSEGKRVMISRTDTPYFRARFLGARRPSEGGFLWELTST